MIGHISSPVSFILKTVSKVVVYPRLFHNLVRHIPGLYFSINRHLDIDFRLEPYVVIAPAVVVKNKTMLL
jgi:hypothetical protein